MNKRYFTFITRKINGENIKPKVKAPPINLFKFTNNYLIYDHILFTNNGYSVTAFEFVLNE